MPEFSPTALASLFPSQAVLDTLGVLFANPEREFYQAEIVQRLPYTKLQVQRALKRITDAGVANERRDASRVYYQAARQSPVFAELRSLLDKTVGLTGQLRQALEPIREDLLAVFIFGSVASGTERADSDLDLFCVGQVRARKLAGIIGPFGRSLGREINCVHYQPEDFQEKLRSHDDALAKILADDRVWLIGTEDDFASVLGS